MVNLQAWEGEGSIGSKVSRCMPTARACSSKQAKPRGELYFFIQPAKVDIFETLADTGEGKDYEKAVKALNGYFIPKVNSTYQNHLFRGMEQQDGETVAQFVTRLRQVVKDCDYGEQAENQIRDQVVQRCKSHELRKKLLEKGEKLTLELLLSMAANHERVQSQLENMEGRKM